MVETPRPLDDVDWPLRTERLVIRRAAIKRIRVGELEVDQLTVRRLRVLEHDQPADDR